MPFFAGVRIIHGGQRSSRWAFSFANSFAGNNLAYGVVIESMKPEIAAELQQRALATLARTDALTADSAEVIKFEDLRWGGQYVIVRQGAEVVAVYKVSLRPGPARADGKGAFVVSSLSIGLKRLKRVPKGLIA